MPYVTVLFRMKLAFSLIGLSTPKLSPFDDDVIYSLDFVGEKADLQVPGMLS